MRERLQEFRLFFHELLRRRVAQVAVAYVVGAWVVIEASSVILPAFEAPNWVLQLVIVVGVLGFPLVLVAAWIFDWTPGGLVRTEPAETRTEESDADAAPVPPSDTDASSAPMETQHADEQTYAERRQITVLRFALQCSDDAGEPLDPETLREVLPDAQKYCAGIVERYNGHLAWAYQDEGEAYFGYPKALEHDARSAVRCAIGLRDGIGNVATSDDVAAMQVSVAIHTGLAVTESPEVSGDRGPLTGEFSRTVASLLGLAPSGEIVISDSTRALVHDYYDLSRHEKLRSRDTYLVGEEQESLIYRSAYNRAAGQLLGRDHELALLKDRWERAVSGQGQTVSLAGEPGIGKSALVGAVIDHCARSRDVLIAECGCTPFNQNVALYPIARLFRRSLLARVVNVSPADQLRSIEKFFAERDIPLGDNVALLARFLEVPLDGRYDPLDLSPEKLKDKTLELIIQILFHRAADQPVLLVIEDLHWSDPTTLDLIGRIIDHGPEAHFLLLLTHRPERIPPWSTRTDITHVSLGNLTRSQADGLVKHAAGAADLPQEIREKIVAYSDGVPLFLEELTRTVVETASEATSLDNLDIPSTLQDTLMARLDRLGPAKRTAQTAAVFGREFSFEWIEALTGLEPEKLEQDLDVLVASGLAYQRGIRPASRYIYKHALIQEEASRSLLRRDRQQIHKRIAKLFTGRFADYGDSHPQVVAMHFANGGDNARAIPLYIKAGKSALADSAYREAVSNLQAGLDLIEGVEQNRERDALELDLQASLGRAMTATQGYAAHEVEQRWLRACELAEELGETGTQVGVTMGLWQGQISQGRLLEALEQAGKLLQLASQTGQQAALYATQTAAGITRFHLGELERSEAYFEQVSTGYDLEKNRGAALRFGQDPCVTSLIWHAVSRWLRGYPDDARANVEKSLELARRLDHPFTLAYALRRSIPVLYYAGDQAAMAATITEVAELASENSFAEVSAQAAFWQLIVEATKTGGEGSLLEATRIVGQYQQFGTALNLCHALGLIAEQYLRSGNPSAGLPHIENALATAERTREMWCAADLHRLHGEIMVAIEPRNTAAATVAYQRAVDCARSQGAGFLELRARLALARLYRDCDDMERVAGILAPAAGLIHGNRLRELEELAEYRENCRTTDQRLS